MTTTYPFDSMHLPPVMCCSECGARSPSYFQYWPRGGYPMDFCSKACLDEAYTAWIRGNTWGLSKVAEG